HERETIGVVILATGLGGEIPLAIAGADCVGVYGAGHIAKLLNADATETQPSCPIPQLGQTTTVVGNGNVAMDIVRLLAMTKEQLASSDIDEPTHAGLPSG